MQVPQDPSIPDHALLCYPGVLQYLFFQLFPAFCNNFFYISRPSLFSNIFHFVKLFIKFVSFFETFSTYFFPSRLFINFYILKGFSIPKPALVKKRRSRVIETSVVSPVEMLVYNLFIITFEKGPLCAHNRPCHP